jgi:hypothetical protein
MTPALSVLKRTLEEQGLGIAPLAGVDLARDVRRITLCRLPQAGSARRDYVVAMSGPIPADVLAGVNDLAKNADPPGDVAGATMARDGKVWLGTLVAANAEPQLVVATSRDLLRAALTGVDGRYPLDARASLSFVVNSSEFGLRTDRVPVADVNDVKAISSIVVSVAGDATVLRARFIIGDSAIAGRLATNMRPVVTELARRIVGDGRGPMDVSLEVTGGDMVSSVNLPAGSLELVAARLVSHH